MTSPVKKRQQHIDMAETDVRPEYRCLICTKPYNEPRQLPCGHTFCCRCLTSYIEAEHVTADEDRHLFPCPACNAPSASGVSKRASHFPINNVFLTPTAKTSDVHFCAPCLSGNESSPAEVWCTECAELLCKQCKTFHQRSRALAKHRLVSISGNVGEFCDIAVNEICHQHTGKPLDVYCVDHSAMCCSICVSVSHRKCNNVKPIEDVIKKTMVGQSHTETEWRELTEETRKMLDDDDLGMTLINSTEKEVLAEMANRIQKSKDKLDNLNATFQSELADKCNALRKKQSVRRMCVNTFHTNAENSHRLMSRSDQHISERHRVFMREQTKNQIAGHYRRMDKNTKKQPNRFDISLKLGTLTDEIMKVTTLGNIDVTTTISAVSQSANVCIGTLIGTLLSTPSATTFAADVWTASVSCVQRVDSITLRGSCRSFLAGSIFTVNNELLIADLTNKRLLLFDDTYSYMKEYTIEGQPSDIAHGRTADEIFVAVDENHILQCTLRNGQLSVINKISSPDRTWGIAVLGENILVGTIENVNVITVDGKVTKAIKKSGVNTYFAISTSKATVYHKDDNEVVCRRLDSGTEVCRYGDDGLKSPAGIALDQEDNVYVCGENSGNVYLVSPDGSRGRVLLTKLCGIDRPYCIVVHPNKQEFLITSYRETTVLEVYRFNDTNI